MTNRMEIPERTVTKHTKVAVAKAIHDFKARLSDELTIVKDDILELLEGSKSEKGWCLARQIRHHDKKGLIPLNHVERIQNYQISGTPVSKGYRNNVRAVKLQWKEIGKWKKIVEEKHQKRKKKEIDGPPLLTLTPVIQNINGVQLRENDLLSLQATHWVEDKPIHGYLHLLCQHRESMYAFECGFLQYLDLDGSYALSIWTRDVLENNFPIAHMEADRQLITMSDGILGQYFRLRHLALSNVS